MSELEHHAVTAGAAGSGRRQAGKAGRPGRYRELEARVKLQIDLPGGSRIGPGKILLLELVESEGSLSRAAEAMGISYRRAWLFMQQVNAAFDEPAVATPEHGQGGSAARLTDFGRELISKYRGLEEAANVGGRNVLKWLVRHERAG